MPQPFTRRACLAGLLGALGQAHAAPPAVNFRLQWRLVPWPPAPVTQAVPGSVTIGTGTGTAAAQGMSTRTVPPATEAPPELLVRNGGQARIAWLRDDPQAAPDWVWTAEGGQGGLRGRTRRLSRRDALWVQVQWPGGSAPAQLGFRFEQPLDDARPAAGQQQLEGELLLALDAWQEVGHWAGADGRGQALQLKLSRLP